MDILDRDHLIDNVDGDPELLEEIVDLFFESSVEILDTIQAAVMKADAESLNASAHQLKGALANVGAKAATAAASELEQLGRAGTMTGLETAWESLETEMNRLEPELQELVRSHKD